MSETSGELGGALGIAILGSIGTAVYRSNLAADLPTGIGDVSYELSLAACEPFAVDVDQMLASIRSLVE